VYAVEFVQDRVIYWYMMREYHVRLDNKGVLRIDKGIPVRWFYIIKNNYKSKCDIKNIIVE